MYYSTYLLLGLVLLLLVVIDGLGLLLALCSITGLGSDLDTSSKHLLKLELIAGPLLLLSLGEELALLLELLNALLLLLLPDSLGLLATLLLLGSLSFLFLGSGLGFGIQASLLFLSFSESLLLLLDLEEMGWDLLLLASCIGGGGSGSSLLLLLLGSSLDGCGSLCGSTALLLCGLQLVRLPRKT